jgi:hypothetical protein
MMFMSYSGLLLDALGDASADLELWLSGFGIHDRSFLTVLLLEVHTFHQ